MTEIEAYGLENIGWVKRASQTFSPGDVVRLGPAYRGYRVGGATEVCGVCSCGLSEGYAPDGKEGVYTVLGPFGVRDYYLAKGIVSKEEIEISLYDVIASASRLVRVQGSVSDRGSPAAYGVSGL